MKLIIGAMGQFTMEALKTALQEEYGNEDFYKNAAGNSFYGNLSYWAKAEKLEKSGDGADATFKVLDKEFFGNVEFK